MSSSEDEEPSTTMHREPRFTVDDDTLRIMISTDNHLGYAERDPVRGNDSFAAFEEVLYLAQRFHCDMVLIAGDLFHENRPTRNTLYKTMDIMRRYCMGPNPVKIRILSDATKNFRSGSVNYLDPNYSVHLPVFSIHGNHDDPSRDPGCKEMLAALDLLSMSNFINYFGRQDNVEKIEVSPLLIEKGGTKVAIYGLGAMREARLNRMWASKKVQFLRPEEDEEDHEDDSGFLNIFALHQNRDFGRGAKNCVQETMIPEWMDIVVFGHEHECLIAFSESVVGTFRITQPGSSVATSLVAGEAVRKHVGVLDVKGRRYRMDAIPLTQVRAFVTADLSLKEHRLRLDPEDPKVDDKINALLEKEVKVAVRNARDRMNDVITEASAAGNLAAGDDSPLRNRLEKPNEVLIRLRVEHSGFSTINNQRFGARFVGEVANATDILLFHRRKDMKAGNKKLSDKQRQAFLKTPLDPENIERVHMEDLVLDFFSNAEQQERALRMLDKARLTESLAEYVDKNASSTIEETTDKLIAEKQKLLLEKLDHQDVTVKGSAIREFFDEELVKDVEKSVDRERSYDRRNTTRSEDERVENISIENQLYSESEDSPPASSRQTPNMSRGRTSNNSNHLRRSFNKQSIELGSDDDELPSRQPHKSNNKVSRPKRGFASQIKTYRLDSDSEGDADYAADDGRQNGPKRARPVASKTEALASEAKPRSQTTRKRSRLLDDSDDESDDFVSGKGFENEHWGSAATKSQY